MSVLTVMTLLIAVTATYGTDETGNGEASTVQTGIPKKPFNDLLTYGKDEYKIAFQALDVNNDNVIQIDDLKTFYYHKDSEFAIKKFMELLDTQKTPGSIDLEEFTDFMNKDQVKRQAQEITFIRTVEERKHFYADEILTYVYLVIDRNAIDKLFDLIDCKKDGQLDINEIKGMKVKVMNGDTKYALSDGEAKIVLAEVGGGSDTINKEDFKYYLLDGELGFLFRECRKILTATGAEYDNACLINKLVHYTTMHLTEYMMSVMFDALDIKNKDKRVTFDEVQLVFGCNEWNARHFIRYIGEGSGVEMKYAELRAVLATPAIKTYLEHGCYRKDKDLVDFKGKAFCLIWKLWNLISKNFFPKYVGVPDLDLIFLFEDLDTSDDGIIEQKKDLEEGKRWTPDLAAKFMEELEQPDSKGKVNLHDFFNYVYEPYMMCAVGECQLIKENNEKLACYNNEMNDMMTNVLGKKDVEEFFSFYKSNVIFHETLEEIEPAIPGPVVENFLVELGLGDHYVKPSEFKYFVKQQDLGRLFVTEEKVSPKNHLPGKHLHEKLLYYLEHYMTEYDTEMLFARLDVNGDRVLDSKDIRRARAIDADFIARIALYGNKEHASLHEFWIFLNSKAPGAQEPRKRQLERECGQVNQENQMICCLSKLKELH